MAGGIGDDIAIANGFFPRGTRAVWIIPITILTIVGDYSVLLFYLVAYGARLSILRHPLHKMIIMMFVFNFIGAFLLYFVGFVNPESVGCKAGIFIIVGSVTGDYCAAFSICWMLFQSLVLQWRRTNLMETLTLFFPPLTALLYGLLTIGGSGPMDRDGACWLDSMTSWRSLLLYAGSFTLGVSTAVMGIAIGRNLNRHAQVNSSLRVPAGGMLSVGSSLREDAQVLTKRLIWYPVAIVLFGGGGALVGVVGGRWGMVIGEQMLMATGLVNSSVFFLLDPTPRTISTALLEAVEASWGVGRTAGSPYAKEMWDVQVPWGVHVAGRMRGLLRAIARNRF